MLKKALAIAAVLGVTGAMLVGSTTVATAAIKPPPTTYTVTRAAGPFSGTDAGLADREATTMRCENNHHSMVSGSATIVRKTTHGTASRDVLTPDIPYPTEVVQKLRGDRDRRGRRSRVAVIGVASRRRGNGSSG